MYVIKNKLNAHKGIVITMVLTIVIAFTVGNRTHDALTAAKNNVTLRAYAMANADHMVDKQAVQAQIDQAAAQAKAQGALEATSSANLHQLYQSSVHYNPATGTVESSLAK